MPSSVWGSTLVTEAVQATTTLQKKLQPPINKAKGPQKLYKWDIVWLNVIIMVYFYAGGLYGLFLIITTCSWLTVLWTLYVLVIGTLGATAGSHRLWTHRAYKAKLPLRILLAYFQCTCFQNHIYEWVRDHRMHHKYTDTDADPHNASRGFFFSHVGWLLVRKHKEIKEKGKTIYMEDLKADPVVMLQKKYYGILMPLFCFLIPAVVPWYFWSEPFTVAWYVSIFRYSINVNGTWLVNSAAHIYGTRPYDKNILPRQNTFVGYIGMGEGWHNYHHVFPWDYKASEFCGYSSNLTTGFIDLCSKIGWAYDLKSVSEEMIAKRKLRTGDGSDGNPQQSGRAKEKCEMVWGWGDEDMTEQEKTDVITYNALKNDDI